MLAPVSVSVAAPVLFRPPFETTPLKEKSESVRSVRLTPPRSTVPALCIAPVLVRLPSGTSALKTSGLLKLRPPVLSLERRPALSVTTLNAPPKPELPASCSVPPFNVMPPVNVLWKSPLAFRQP